VIRIYHCERKVGGAVEYIVEDSRGKLSKCEGRDLRQMSHTRLVDLLEKTILQMFSPIGRLEPQS
jgi:hypothetical protein